MDPRAYPPAYNAEELTTDFMTGICEHAVRALRYYLPESALLSTPIEYIVRSWEIQAECVVVLR